MHNIVGSHLRSQIAVTFSGRLRRGAACARRRSANSVLRQCPQALCSTRPTSCPLLITRRPHGRRHGTRKTGGQKVDSTTPPPFSFSSSSRHLWAPYLLLCAPSVSSIALAVPPASPSQTDPRPGWFPIMQDGSRSPKTPPPPHRFLGPRTASVEGPSSRRGSSQDVIPTLRVEGFLAYILYGRTFECYTLFPFLHAIASSLAFWEG